MTLRTKADCYFNPSAPNPNLFNEIFVSCVQALSGPLGQSCGISMVESNFGRTGVNLGFWDDNTMRCGPGAFAVFRFNSSSYGRFDMMITVGSGSAVTSNGTAPMLVDGQSLPLSGLAGNGLVGVSFAVHPSGSSTVPWNGSTGSFSSGTIGSPVWQGDATGKIAVFPRNNVLFNGNGSYSVQRNATSGIIYYGNTVPVRQHFILTEDSFTTAWDSGNTGLYQILHFGPYIPRGGNSPEAPYVLVKSNAGAPDPQFYTTTYGALTLGANNTNSSTTTTFDGGIATPLLSVSGTRILALTCPGATTIDSNIGGFNPWISSGSYDVLPLFAAIREGPDTGILGTMKYVGITYGIASDTVDTLSSSVAFGAATAGTRKWIFPWTGSAPRTSSSSRTGRDT
jgi:hypothetical protein